MIFDYPAPEEPEEPVDPEAEDAERPAPPAKIVIECDNLDTVTLTGQVTSGKSSDDLQDPRPFSTADLPSEEEE